MAEETNPFITETKAPSPPPASSPLQTSSDNCSGAVDISSSQGSSPLPTSPSVANPITRALTRKRSFKRQAPAPPAAGISRSSSATSVLSTSSLEDSKKDASLLQHIVTSEAVKPEVALPKPNDFAPPTPTRSQSSHEAIRKLAPTVLPNHPVSPPPNLLAAQSPRCSSPPQVLPHSGPLVTVAEEVTEADGTVVGESAGEWAHVPRRRLERSESLVTVAHIYEDLYVISPFVKVTLTNLSIVTVLAAVLLPNTAILLYTLFRYNINYALPCYYRACVHTFFFLLILNPLNIEFLVLFGIC